MGNPCTPGIGLESTDLMVDLFKRGSGRLKDSPQSSGESVLGKKQMSDILTQTIKRGSGRFEGRNDEREIVISGTVLVVGRMQRREITDLVYESRGKPGLELTRRILDLMING